jgi:predicted RNase H-like nuclease (RuvC/YqgF family)
MKDFSKLKKNDVICMRQSGAYQVVIGFDEWGNPIIIPMQIATNPESWEKVKRTMRTKLYETNT